MKEKNLKFKNRYVRQGVTYFCVGAALILAFYAVNNMNVIVNGIDRINDILMPFYLGIVMAYLMCPVYNSTTRLIYTIDKGWFKKPINDLKSARIIATIISIAVIIVIIVGLFMLIIPDLLESITGLILGLPATVDKLVSWVQEHIEENPQIVVFLSDRLDNMTENILKWAQEKLLPGAEVILNNVSLGVIGTVSMVFDLFVALIICVYVLNSKEIFKAQAKKTVLAAFSNERAEKIFEFGRLTNETFGGFINGKIIDSIIIGIICFGTMSVLKLPLAMLISVIVGVTNIIPFFGPFIGAIPSGLILLLIEPLSALKFVVMILVLQQIDGNIIGPKILGKTTKLASFWVMFAIIFLGGLFGFLGMILGVPVFAIIYTYLSRMVNGRLKKKNLETETLLYEDFSKYNIDKEIIFGERINCTNKGNDDSADRKRKTD